MTKMILYDSILTYELAVFLIVLTGLIIKRKMKIRQYIYLCGLFSVFTLFVKNVFKNIVIGEPMWSMEGQYSLIPFGNLIPLIVKDANLTGEMRTFVLDFFIGIVPFFLLSGFFVAGILRNKNKISYKKLFIFGIIILELLLVLAFLFVHNNMVYIGIFDTSAFLLVPILYGLGLFVYKVLFDDKELKLNDKN